MTDESQMEGEGVCVEWRRGGEWREINQGIYIHICTAHGDTDNSVGKAWRRWERQGAGGQWEDRGKHRKSVILSIIKINLKK